MFQSPSSTIGSAELAGLGRTTASSGHGASPGARLSAAEWTVCTILVRAVNAHQRACFLSSRIKLKRQVLSKLYARQAVGAYHSRALPISANLGKAASLLSTQLRDR